MNQYQISLSILEEKSCLKLSSSNRMIRQWFGKFAELVWEKLITHKIASNKTVNLNKKQVHSFFTDITYLYQKLIFQYKIDQDLIKNKFPEKYFSIAQSLLLQIRINPCHPSFDDLLSHFLDEFSCCDQQIFERTLNLLIVNQLIQSIITEDGREFYDKNTNPHDHLYFKKQHKLVDCSEEIKQFLISIDCTQFSKKNQSKLFTLNSNLT